MRSGSPEVRATSMSVNRPPKTAGPICRHRRLAKGAGASAGPDVAATGLPDCRCAEATGASDATMAMTPSNVREDETADPGMAGSPNKRNGTRARDSASERGTRSRRDSVVEYRNAYAAMSMGVEARAARQFAGYSERR